MAPTLPTACGSLPPEGAGLAWGGPALAAVASTPLPCSLCQSDGGLLVFANPQLRIIQASEAGFPAFYRVVWMRHVAEFSDLSADERTACMDAVVTVEQILRSVFQPTKINLAALGNVVPHLHWHVVARFDWDSHFPAPVWSAPQRALESEKLVVVAARCADVNRLIAEKMAH
jgi:diadenosine tetraphosphate (Ap4A) HIT family hydrolase